MGRRRKPWRHGRAKRIGRKRRERTAPAAPPKTGVDIIDDQIPLPLSLPGDEELLDEAFPVEPEDKIADFGDEDLFGEDEPTKGGVS